MKNEVLRQIRPAVVLLLLFTLLTGVAYPLAVTGLAWALFPGAAGGSLIAQGGRVVGSRLIGQPFDDSKYFWGRPSATSPYPYNAGSSRGSNLGPLNTALAEAVQSRALALRSADPAQQSPIPIDLVTSSASGLDPHISPAAALYQLHRVAAKRKLPVEDVKELVDRHIEPRTLRVLGEPRVNVLLLNLALDELR